MPESSLYQDKHIKIDKDNVCVNGATILTRAIQSYQKVSKTPLYAWVFLSISLAIILFVYSNPKPPPASSFSLSSIKKEPSPTNNNLTVFCIMALAGVVQSFRNKRHFVIINTGAQLFKTPDLENGDSADRIIQALNQVTRRA